MGTGAASGTPPNNAETAVNAAAAAVVLVQQDAVDQLDALTIAITPGQTARELELQEERNDFYQAESIEQQASASNGEKESSSTDTTAATADESTKNGSSNDAPAANGKTAALTDSTTPTDAATSATKDATTTTPDHKRFVSPKDFSLLKVIGMGAFGKVLQVRNKRSKKTLAMKVISKRLLRRKVGYIENVQAERNILTRIRHPFVVTMHCSFQSREKLFIIMDFLAGGELFLRLGREGIFREETAAFYLAEIILALDYLHLHGVLHRDLKPENILLGSDGHVCLTDFGLAKDFSGQGGFQTEEDDSRALTVCGTQEYMAPEMIARKGYGRAADYWSLGCIAYEMLSGLPPFNSKNGGKDLFRKIMSEKVKMPVGSSGAHKLLKGLLNRNVQSRLGTSRSTMFEVGGVAGLKNSEFFTKMDWDKLERKEIEPPERLPVEHDEDLKHFHEEFTEMPLPRSVVEMNHEGYTARRVESEHFRGFSFIQDDFALPDRHDNEVSNYWEATEEDAESVSDCASSKAGGESGEPAALEETIGQKKKRPPRKRKKKKGAIDSAASTPAPSAAATPAASTDNTPAPSVANSPTPSENGDAAKPTVVVPVVAAGSTAPVQARTVPKKKPPVQKWQSVSAAAKKEPAAKAPLLQSQWSAVKPKPQQQAPVQRGGWAQAPTRRAVPGQNPVPNKGQQRNQAVPSARQNAPAPQSRNQAPVPVSTRRPVPPPLQVPAGGYQQEQLPTPSSDWRNHHLGPRRSPDSSRAVHQPPTSWPSLGPAPPLGLATSTVTAASPKAATPPATKAQGAWATRTKR